MALTLNDITPVGLCIATQDLFDAKRFQTNFCDNLVLRFRDSNLASKLLNVKRQLNSDEMEKKFIEGHKAAIVSNIDKIISLALSRYAQNDMRLVEEIVSNGKELIDRVLMASNFGQIAMLEPVFKTKVTLPVYELFIESMKRSKIPMV